MSEENYNINLNYSEEKNDGNTIINTDNQLSKSEIATFSDLYKITEKNPEEAIQHLLRSDLNKKLKSMKMY